MNIPLCQQSDKYDKSLFILNSINKDNSEFNENRMHIKYIFEMIDTRIRYAESLLENDNKKCLSILNEAIVFIDGANQELFDFTIYNVMFKLLHIYIRLLSSSNYDLDNLINYLFKYHNYILAVKKKHKIEERFNKDLNSLLEKIQTDDAHKINDILNYKGIIKQKNVGHIYKINIQRGFGFITPVSYSYQSIYFNCNQFKGDFRKLERGERVSFELSIDKDKISALNVELDRLELKNDIIDESLEVC